MAGYSWAANIDFQSLALSVPHSATLLDPAVIPYPGSTYPSFIASGSFTLPLSIALLNIIISLIRQTLTLIYFGGVIAPVVVIGCQVMQGCLRHMSACIAFPYKLTSCLL